MADDLKWHDASRAAISDWIDWTGGDMPVDAEELVQCEFRGPPLFYNTRARRAGDFYWGHSSSSYRSNDILRYRIIRLYWGN